MPLCPRLLSFLSLDWSVSGGEKGHVREQLEEDEQDRAQGQILEGWKPEIESCKMNVTSQGGESMFEQRFEVQISLREFYVFEIPTGYLRLDATVCRALWEKLSHRGGGGSL